MKRKCIGRRKKSVNGKRIIGNVSRKIMSRETLYKYREDGRTVESGYIDTIIE